VWLNSEGSAEDTMTEAGLSETAQAKVDFAAISTPHIKKSKVKSDN
jgi:hypothetical protein